MAAKTKRLARNANANGQHGGFFPARLVPLSVYACWLQGEWGDLEGKNGEFTFEDGVIYLQERDACGKRLSTMHAVADLPEGLDCEHFYHNESRDVGFFVGRTEDVRRAKEIAKERSRLDAEIGDMMHFDGKL